MKVDLEQLRERYHIIATKGANDLDTYDALRVLDDEIEAGVQAVFDDDGQSIVAFMFSKGSFDEDEAEAWIDKAEEEGVNLTVFGMTIRMSLDDTSFADVTNILAEALGQGVLLDEETRYPWLLEVYPEFCIVELGASLYKIPYTVDRKNRVAFGDMVKVKRKYIPIKTQITVSPGIVHVLAFHLRESILPADVAVDNDGLIWKEIFQVSTTFRPMSGSPVEVDQGMIDGVFDSFQAGVLKNVPITANTHRDEDAGIIPAEETVGFVRKAVKVDGHLFAGLEIIDNEVRDQIDSGLITDVSVYVWFDFHDQRDGEIWDFVLVHLLLTNYPQLVGLDPFGAKPTELAAAIADGVKFIPYEEVTMPEQTTLDVTAPLEPVITEAQRTLLTQLETAGLTGDDIRAFAAQRQAVQDKARDLEIKAIVAALEGKSEHDGVIQVSDARHYPVVIAKVEELLRGATQAMGMAIDAEGKTILDTVALDIVNALPQEARLALDTQPARPTRSDAQPDLAEQKHRTTPLPPDVVPSDESIAELDKSLGGA